MDGEQTLDAKHSALPEQSRLYLFHPKTDDIGKWDICVSSPAAIRRRRELLQDLAHVKGEMYRLNRVWITEATNQGRKSPASPRRAISRGESSGASPNQGPKATIVNRIPFRLTIRSTVIAQT